MINTFNSTGILEYKCVGRCNCTLLIMHLKPISKLLKTSINSVILFYSIDKIICVYNIYVKNNFV